MQSFFIFLWLKPHLMGFQNDTTEEQSLTSMFGKKTQERQHLPWGAEQKQGAVFPNKRKNKNIQSNHYKVRAPLHISSGYLRWIKANPEAHATTGKESRCLGHFPGYFMMKKPEVPTVLALHSSAFICCSTPNRHWQQRPSCFLVCYCYFEKR